MLRHVLHLHPAPAPFKIPPTQKELFVVGCSTAWRAARRGNVRHRPKHTATRLPPAEPPEARAEILFVPQAKSLTSRLWRCTALKNVRYAPAGPLEPCAEVLCRRRRRYN